jgi:hypothetical protein
MKAEDHKGDAELRPNVSAMTRTLRPYHPRHSSGDQCGRSRVRWPGLSTLKSGQPYPVASIQNVLEVQEGEFKP